MSHITKPLRHDKLCVNPIPLKLLMVFCSNTSQYHSMNKEGWSFWFLASSTQSSSKRFANNKRDIKNNFRIIKGKVCFNWLISFISYLSDQPHKKSVLCTTVNKSSQCHKVINSHKQKLILVPQNFFLFARDEVLASLQSYNFTGVIASMTGGTMINAVSNYGIRLGTLMQSFAKSIIAQNRNNISIQEHSSDFHFTWILFLSPL